MDSAPSDATHASFDGHHGESLIDRIIRMRQRLRMLHDSEHVPAPNMGSLPHAEHPVSYFIRVIEFVFIFVVLLVLGAFVYANKYRKNVSKDLSLPMNFELKPTFVQSDYGATFHESVACI